MTSPAWVAPADVDDAYLVAAAARRARARLTDGRIVRLVSWPGGRQPRDRHAGRSARVENGAGSRYRVPCSAVEAVAT